ncbi:MAG: DNA polymerase III subunit gamma/tau [Geminicoccaceae bacterium]
MAEQPQATNYRVLARTYRPGRLSELIGQDALVRTLTNAFRSGRIAHAFMLTGIRGVGKTTTARIIARALNCTGPDGKGGPTPEPCGVCDNCRAIAEDRHIDVVEMDAASHTGVDDVRDLIDAARYAPSLGRCKVYIIDEVHMLSRSAFNALLKTLEEPPGHTKFVFATTEIRKVPVTILSRCQRFDLKRVPTDTLVAHLHTVATHESVEVSNGALALIAKSAEGSVRDSLSLLDQAIAMADGGIDEVLVQSMLGLADRSRALDLFDALMRGDVPAALDRIAELDALGADMREVLNDLLDITHGLSLAKVDAGLLERDARGADDQARMAAMAEQLSVPVLTRCWQILLKGVEELRLAGEPRLALEMLAVRLAFVADLPPPGALVRADTAFATGQVPPPRPSASRATPAAAPARQSEPTGSTARGRTATAPAAAITPADPAPEPEALRSPPPAPKVPQSFEAAVDAVRAHGDVLLASYLFESAHPVHFEPGRVELRLKPNVPPNVPQRFAEALRQITDQRWMVSVVHAGGEPTLAERESAYLAQRRVAVQGDPLVRATMQRFPGTRILEVRKLRAGDND